MGGSSAAEPPPPSDNKAQTMLLQMQGQAGRDALERQNQIELMRSAQPIETSQIDIYGPSGALNTMSQVAAINAYKSKELERTMNPTGAKMREDLQNEQAAGMNPNYWQNQMAQWSKKTGF